MPKKKKIDLDLSEGPDTTAKTTDIYNVFILDKSGSMGGVRDVTIDGLNKAVSDIKEDAEKDTSIAQHVSIVTFSDADKIENVIWNSKAQSVSKLTREDYSPMGGTALLDAIGVTVSRIKNDAAISEGLAKKTAQVFLTVMTDGEENTSKEFKHDQIEKMVKELQDDANNGWTIAYIGASPKTVQHAVAMGFSAANTMQYDASQIGTQAAFASYSSNAKAYRSASSQGLKSCKANFFSLADDEQDKVDLSVKQSKTTDNTADNWNNGTPPATTSSTTNAPTTP